MLLKMEEGCIGALGGWRISALAGKFVVCGSAIRGTFAALRFVVFICFIKEI
jgi:hypothetical protein